MTNIKDNLYIESIKTRNITVDDLELTVSIRCIFIKYKQKFS